MNELTAQDENLLQKLRDQPELTGLFFRKAKSLKWFNRLREEGYFDPRTLSGPVPVDDQDDRVRIPAWQPIDYLNNTVKEVSEEGNEDFANAYLNIIEDVTNCAKEQELENYQVWWRFATILTSLPANLIEVKHVWLAEYWLKDRFDRSLVARELGKKWLPKLLDAGDEHSLALAEELLGLLIRVECGPKSEGRDTCDFFFDAYHANEIIQACFYQCGEKIGDAALKLIDASLREVLTRLGNDKWSSVWQPAIEDHDQNRHREDAGNLLVLSFREALRGFIDAQQGQAIDVLENMLDSDIDTIVRIAINAVREKHQYFDELKPKFISKRLLATNLRHEYWHFLHDVYPTLDIDQKHAVMHLIESIDDEEGKRDEGAVAYEKASWLAAIRDFGNEEAAAYAQALELAGAEPEHPDFTSYTTTRWGGGESPYSVEELQSFDPEELVERLAGFQPTGDWKAPTVEGLSKAFKDRIKSDPIDIYKNLKAFIGIDLAYIYVLIEAFSDLWNDKSSLPWESVWPQLLEFIELLLDQDEFWSERNSERRQEFVANRHWVVGAIGRLVEAGSKSDDHAFPVETHSAAKRVIEKILDNQSGEEFALDSDAVSIAINSPRGRCLEGLINLTLRECRLADKNQNDHTAVWDEYVDLFNSELGQVAHQEYEFVTLVTNYLPNFLYLSGEWLRGNLGQIFDQSDEIGWSCAMQGYSYIGTVYQEIYEYLRDHGDLLKALDHEHITAKVEGRFIQQIAVAYLNDFEALDDENSLIKKVIERFIPDELHQLIWFLWTLRGEKGAEYGPKVLGIRAKIQANLNLTKKEDRKIASDLCLWIEYVEGLNEDNMQWLREIVPFADDSHHGSGVLESLARFSNEQPFMANELWQLLLERSLSDYPEEAIRTILKNLLVNGPAGVRLAKETVSIYARNHNERPWEWMKDIQQTLAKK